MYTALYRTERPEVFSEIIGQDHIVKILKNQIAADKVSHAYLFCGTRGTGKTTTARILAKAVNCLSGGERPCGRCSNCTAIKEGNFLDVMEIDAASNNGVDNIRELRESVKYPPAVGRKKVYIIDEVHMLSAGAFNALLKTLEEPPEKVMFILATTEPQKLPQTILSRCMRLDFRRVSEKAMIKHMKDICDKSHIEISDGALGLIASNADGSVRDSLSILDQCMSIGSELIDRDLVLEFLGTVSEEFFIELTERVIRRDVPGALMKIDEAVREGKDVKRLIREWTGHYRSLLITKYIEDAEDMLNMSRENIEKVRKQSENISLGEINRAIITLSKTAADARYSTQPRILLEMAAVALSEGIMENGQDFQPEAAHPAEHKQQPAGTGQRVDDITFAKPEQDETVNMETEPAAIPSVPLSEPAQAASVRQVLPSERADSGAARPKQDGTVVIMTDKPNPEAVQKGTGVSSPLTPEQGGRTNSETGGAHSAPPSEQAEPGSARPEQADVVNAGAVPTEAVQEESAGPVLPMPETEGDISVVQEEISLNRVTEASPKDTGEATEKPMEQAGPQQGEGDLNMLWDRMIDQGRKIQGSINLLRNNTELSNMNEKEFTVRVRDPFYEGYLKKNSSLIISAMETVTGKKLRMKCVLEENGQNKEDR